MASVLCRIETGHLDLIHDARGDFFGKLLATCSSDRTVKLYEIRPDGQHIPIAKLTEHQGPVWQLSWAHPMYGDLLASCSYDRKVIIWKGQQSQWSKGVELNYHEASVNTVCWAPKEYGLRIAFGSSDAAISIVTLDSTLGIVHHASIREAHPNGCNAISWKPSSQSCAVSDPLQPMAAKDAMIASGGCDGLIKIWTEEDNGDWREQFRLKGHNDWIRDVEWDPSSTPLSHRIASCSQDRTVIIWRTAQLSDNAWSQRALPKFDDVVWGVSWSACGMFLAVSHCDNQVSIWRETPEKEWTNVSGETRKSKQPTPSRRRYD